MVRRARGPGDSCQTCAACGRSPLFLPRVFTFLPCAVSLAAGRLHPRGSAGASHVGFRATRQRGENPKIHLHSNWNFFNFYLELSGSDARLGKGKTNSHFLCSSLICTSGCFNLQVKVNAWCVSPMSSRPS